MEQLCFALLLVFLGECHGQTHFIYRAEYKKTVTCETKNWQISTKSDNQINLNCSVQCDHIEIELHNDNDNDDDDDDDDKEELDVCTKKHPNPDCKLRVKSGFVACVKSLEAGFLFPFKSSPNVIHSYILAVPNTHITSTPEKTSSLTVTEGGSVSLNCSFIFRPEYNNIPFVVYWIKTVGEISICVYSYDFSVYDGIKYNHHCTVPEELINRTSNQTKEPNSHNISVSKVKESDSGQYLCALQVNPGDKKTEKGNWTVIQNITVSVHKTTTPQPTETTETQTTSETTTQKTSQTTSENTTQNRTEDTADTDGDHHMGLYFAVPTILCVLLVVVIVLIRKKCFTSQGSETVKQREEEEASNMDCSPYAVGNGDMGNSFTSKNPGPEDATPSLDPYSVVRLNSLYESGSSDSR